MTTTIVRGVGSIFDAYFYEEDDATPQYVVGGVSYNVIAFNNMSIAAGIAEQDPINPARWKLNVTIPLTAPLTLGKDFYTLVWKAKSSKGNTNTQRDKFYVSDSNANQAGPDDGVTIAMQNYPFVLSLSSETNDIRGLSLRIIREGSDNPILTLTNLTDGVSQGILAKPVADGVNWRYNININNNLLTAVNSQGNRGGLSSYFAYYNYLDAQNQEQVVVNPIYIINGTLLGIMNAMNQYCNMLRNSDVVHSLQITEAKLVHFAIQGLLKLNATSPGNFGFDFNTLGTNQTFYYWATKCAELELLQALYLAEGMSAFDFSGMTVQLNADRTQYIAQAIGELQNSIDSQLPKVKSQYARAGGGSGRLGTINLNIGPASNYGLGYAFRGGLGGAGLGFGGFNLPFLY